MTDLNTAAIKQALDALEETVHWRTTGIGRPPEQTAMDAITSLREALIEQPAQQEPVAIPDCGEAGHDDGACGNRECLPSFRRSTTSPPAQRKPLTDEQINAGRREWLYSPAGSPAAFEAGIRFAEAAHDIKEQQ